MASAPPSGCSVLGEPDVARELQAQRFSATAQSVPVDQLDGLWAEATSTGDETVARATGRAIASRLRSEIARDARLSTSATRQRHATLVEQVDQWHRDNPPLRQRLDRIERAKSNIAVMVEQSARHALAIYGVGRASSIRPSWPIPEPKPTDGRIRVGAFFERVRR